MVQHNRFLKFGNYMKVKTEKYVTSPFALVNYRI